MIDGVAAADALRCAPEGKVRTVDAGGTLEQGNLTRVVGKDDGVAGGAGVVEGLLVARGDGLGIGASTEANGLSGCGAVSGFLWSLPGSGEGPRIGVRPRRRNI